MYITIPENDYTKYRQIKSLSFAPEVDLTLASLPVNEFRADIITTDSIAVGYEAWLFDDLDQLWALYIVTKSERLDKQTIRIVAQSRLTLLDRWTVPARMFQDMPVATFIDRLFWYSTSGHIEGVTIDVDSYFDNITVTGFCPEQTARERLQWLGLTVGAIVRQCFDFHLQFLPAPDVDPARRAEDGVLVPVSDTFWKPSVTIKGNVKTLRVTGYENFTNIDPEAEPEENEIPGSEPGETLDWQSSVDGDGVTWWYNVVDYTYENEAAGDLPGTEVSIEGVTLMGGEATAQVIGWLSGAYFRPGEIRMDVINNRQYFPGQKVRVYTEEDKIYTGFIQSCDFSFGLQARSTLVLSSDLYEVIGGKLTIEYRNRDEKLGYDTHYIPADEPYDYENPDIPGYTPSTQRTSGRGPGKKTVDYEREAMPDGIKITTLPRKLTYEDREEIDYRGMVVKLMVQGQPFIDRWYPDSIIPRNQLILPVRAVMEDGVRMFTTPPDDTSYVYRNTGLTFTFQEFPVGGVILGNMYNTPLDLWRTFTLTNAERPVYACRRIIGDYSYVIFSSSGQFTLHYKGPDNPMRDSGVTESDIICDIRGNAAGFIAQCTINVNEEIPTGGGIERASEYYIQWDMVKFGDGTPGEAKMPVRVMWYSHYDTYTYQDTFDIIVRPRPAEGQGATT